MKQDMELRDYFAGKALEGINSDQNTIRSMTKDMVHNTRNHGHDNLYDYVAQECYRFADAMLKEREVNQVDKSIPKSQIVTEEQILAMGFKLAHSYTEGSYRTNLYKLGCLEVELIYQGMELVQSELTIVEVNCMPIYYQEIKRIAELLGTWTPE